MVCGGGRDGYRGVSFVKFQNRGLAVGIILRI